MILRDGIPPCIWQWSSLRYLNTSHCPLVSLPELHLPHLRTWIHRFGSLRDVDTLGTCTQLRILKLDSNAVERIPESWSALVNLRHVSLTHNPLRKLPSRVVAAAWKMLQTYISDQHQYYAEIEGVDVGDGDETDKGVDDVGESLV